jgi:2,3-diketo-5-methylthio-1-phosphopentane phosphatase
MTDVNHGVLHGALPIPTPRVYLLDVEGTVAPIAFVYEQLFPYARAHFEQFLWQNEKETEQREARGEDVLAEGSVWRDLMALGAENRMETGEDAPRIWPAPENAAGRNAVEQAGTPRMISMSPAEAIPKFLEYIFWLMDRDRKSTALKSLQGKIWKAGFESGELKGPLFDDVPEALERWSAAGKVAIYSSGSVEAQRLVFRHSIFGDLTGMISNYFDTRTGGKGDAASYAAIAAAMGVAPDAVIFFSDVVRELDAAREAGCRTCLVMREGNAKVDDAHGHRVADTFEREM